MRTLLIDNYDSYTYNLFQLIARVNGNEPMVVRNDGLSWSEFLELGVDNVVLSPGPGRPDRERDFGICARILREATVPVLGVCLGHQGLGMVYGGAVIAAPEVMHGRIDVIYHDGADLFAGVPQGFDAVRYHSLVVELPPDLMCTAWTADGVVMGLRHRQRPLWGVQFHPESICTEYGEQLFHNFRRITLNQPRAERSHGTGRQSTESATRLWERATILTSPDVGGDDAVTSPPYTVRVRRLQQVFDAEQTFVGLFDGVVDAFWLDSSRAEPGLSRFSFMGACDGPLSRTIRYKVDGRELTITQGGVAATESTSIFAYLRREIARFGCTAPEVPFGFHGGFVGYWGYELKAECGGQAMHATTHPDAVCMFADRIIVFDHLEHTTYLVHVGEQQDEHTAERWFDATEQRLRTLPPLPSLPEIAVSDAAEFPVQIHHPHARYLEAIAACQRALRAGESYEICLTTQIDVAIAVDPVLLYRYLRQINPAPYAALLRFDDMAVLSSSPERFLRIDKERQVEAKPIKGTARRSTNTEEDRAVRTALQHDEKVRAENLMIVDLLRNDLGMVCEIGSVHVPKLMDVETYATVHQVVSTIRGTLRPDVDAIACIQAAFPGGSMTGAPKLRTMEIIDELEGEARGVYAGALGWIGLDGSADLSIVIRTLVWTPECVTLGAGGAITVQSDPEAEWEEMLLKAQPLLRALAGVEATMEKARL